MRRLLGLSAGLLLLIGLYGCSNSAGAAKSAGTAGQPASQNTTAEPPATDVSGEPDEEKGTSLNLRGSKGGDMEDRTGNAKAEIPKSEGDQEKAGPAPSIDQVKAYTERIVYPGSLFTSKEGGISSNGKVVIAMTKAPASSATVQEHFEKRGAKTIDQRTENGQTNITMELIDAPAGVKVGITISTALSGSNECLVNYAANPIPRKTGGADSPKKDGGGISLNPQPGAGGGSNLPGNGVDPM